MYLKQSSMTVLITSLNFLCVIRTFVVTTRRSNPNLKILQTLPYNRNTHTHFSQLRLSFAYSGSRMWNDLPLEIWQFETLSVFRKSLKTCLFDLAYSTWFEVATHSISTDDYCSHIALFIFESWLYFSVLEFVLLHKIKCYKNEATSDLSLTITG